ncbi:MAG: small multi-drug export, partial [Spirochaetes bacterium]|nr:small multi-drug export [Spirochaetota bacterium]
MGLNVVKSFLFISLGVLIAGVVVTLLTVLGTTGIILAVAILLTFIIVYTVNIIRKRSDTV